MPDGIEIEPLPDAVVLAYGTQSMNIQGTSGEAHAVVTLDMQFQVEPGRVAQQTFLLHKDDARKLRAALKNPDPSYPVSEEDSTS